ncbi:MAG: hypothetical protein KAX49_20515 [Halanaerobiales bacterium]|nr:hypothetical protein [Halanaerobiales bacterium]
MFTIKYKIIDDIEKLKKIDEKYFEHDLAGEIRGLILLDFNSNLVGFYDDSLPIHVAEIFEELLVLWFTLLNKVIHKLTESKYVALSLIENNSTWIEFRVDNTYLKVSMISMKFYEDNIPLIITEPNKHIEYLEWKNIKITREEFVNEVISKTDLFIQFIEQINPSLLESFSIKELIKLLKKSKSII